MDYDYTIAVSVSRENLDDALETVEREVGAVDAVLMTYHD